MPEVVLAASGIFVLLSPFHAVAFINLNFILQEI